MLTAILTGITAAAPIFVVAGLVLLAVGLFIKFIQLVWGTKSAEQRYMEMHRSTFPYPPYAPAPGYAVPGR